MFELKVFREQSLPTQAQIISQWEDDSTSPLVSVICNTYNHESYIEDALKGFLMQKTDFPFEVIIHDDASDDKTADIINDYVKKYPLIIKPILQKDNQYSINGYLPLLNTIAAANGEYLAMCEGDDLWIEPLKLQKQVSYLENNTDFSMCIHNAVVQDLYHDTQHLFNSKKLPEVLGIKDVILRSWFSPTASFLFKNKTIDISVDKEMNGDILILFLNALQGKIHYSNEVMSVYNYGTLSSLSRASKSNKIKLYQKKWNFLSFVNEKTKNKYILFTSYVFFRTKVGYQLARFGLR